jgi:uncharacterized protein (TIGR00369 family)
MRSGWVVAASKRLQRSHRVDRRVRRWRTRAGRGRSALLDGSPHADNRGLEDRPRSAQRRSGGRAHGGALNREEQVANLLENVARFVPHNQALGIRFVSLIEKRVTLALPYDPKLVGNPMSGVLHGGPITAMLDAACGLSVYVKLDEPCPVATLDLRIDYLRPATPGIEIHARAECVRVTRSVAFVRCDAFHPEKQGDLVAVASGTFMIFRGRGLGACAGVA